MSLPPYWFEKIWKPRVGPVSVLADIEAPSSSLGLTRTYGLLKDKKRMPIVAATQ